MNSADLCMADFQKTLAKVGSVLTKMTDLLRELHANESSSDTEHRKNFGQLVLGKADALALFGNLHIDLSLHLCCKFIRQSINNLH